jgi:hypothetical protein
MHIWGCGGLRKYRDPFFAFSIGLLDLHVIKGVAWYKVALPTGSTSLNRSLIYKYNTQDIPECTDLKICLQKP